MSSYRIAVGSVRERRDGSAPRESLASSLGEETASGTRFANGPASGIRSDRLQLLPESLISGWIKWFYWCKISNVLMDFFG